MHYQELKKITLIKITKFIVKYFDIKIFILYFINKN